MTQAFRVPDGVLGHVVDLGEVTVTAEMIAAYAAAVHDAATLARPIVDAPPTFCLTLRRGFTPELPLPPNLFGVYGGHDLEFHQPLRAGATYRITARIVDVYEKSGRSGALTIVVREALVNDSTGQLAARVTERQIIRERAKNEGGIS